ncbi:hypothetical protein AJ85_04765 [Alkalihalobacillus alcalophilus ATCC 27647 = CGMCC 1.3604]|uniref:Aminoglycoside phosphotransferase domain-containing protein n=1 Tax=Alkalihalobacillus alcalophilus ATCC 27647 = CGMCC 1.3604 TaxID=1218173 RepID=A0A094WL89_ALKAL|nr:spore coat protein YsxE [Alkalihalobacillus alcalophilus]KGA97626.1 hypothetical protein BALCAV_0209240 [Alkalihalobacillus alcalophilus ATCC 27647 = CGMCC 1.3604]MED1561414.1 spore coat protein YsxE [Alkalihalobacillus alcalophilus]THG91441.1 hypothetical protein AJ85_04765 [Alkalihalobacillus alcalophilus ATCC 27647 = CGMCC 1.3604]
MRQEQENPYSSILFYYDVYPQSIEEHGKIKRISTSRGDFALKETTMTPLQADEFVQAMRMLAKHNYHQVIPIIPTKYGEYTISTNSHTYYLMPWVEPVEYLGRESQEEKLIAQMAIVHRVTVQTQKFSKETIEKSYNRLLSHWELRRLELSRFADLAEAKTYMSPFELSFITHAHMLDQMAERAEYHLEKWYEICLEKEKYRTVLCHGRLSRSHSIINMENEPLLINFERASIDTPARDIAGFCRYSFPRAMWSEEEVLKWFFRYEKHLPLLDEEKHLICAYLNFPEPIVFAVEAYVQKKRSRSEIEHVQRLEKRLLSMRKVQRLTQKLIVEQEQEQQ